MRRLSQGVERPRTTNLLDEINDRVSEQVRPGITEFLESDKARIGTTEDAMTVSVSAGSA